MCVCVCGCMYAWTGLTVGPGLEWVSQVQMAMGCQTERRRRRGDGGVDAVHLVGSCDAVLLGCLDGSLG